MAVSISHVSVSSSTQRIRIGKGLFTLPGAKALCGEPDDYTPNTPAPLATDSDETPRDLCHARHARAG